MEALLILIGIFVFLTVLLITSFLLKSVVWLFHPLFFSINYILYFLYNPFRFLYRKNDNKAAIRLFNLTCYSGIYPLYWIVVHLSSFPLRVLVSIYYEAILYFSVMFGDSITEVFNPKRGKSRHLKGFKYFSNYIFGLIPRLLIFLCKNIFTVIDALLMIGISSVFPTFTFYHGTGFKNALVPIAQKGRWLVGNGDHLGSGIYFGIRKKVANHYAVNGDNKGVIIARVTLFPIKNSAMLKPNLKSLIGKNGIALSQNLGFPWATIEHWRQLSNDGWWEYCLVQPNKKQNYDYVSSWRIRPVALLNSKDKPARLWGGMYHYSFSFGAWVAGIFSYAILFSLILFLVA